MNLKLLNYIKNKPIITKADIKKIINCSDNYAYLVLMRLLKKGIIKQVIKGKYTTSDDIYLIASNLEFPSYISLLTASMLKNYTEQIISNIQIITTNKNKKFEYENYNFTLIKSDYVFGYEKLSNGYLIADDNKLLIDMILYQKEVGNFEEIIKVLKNVKFNKKIICDYLNKINNMSVIKRIGFLLEKYREIDIYDKFDLDTNYVYLDILTKEYNTIDKKWGVKHVYDK